MSLKRIIKKYSSRNIFNLLLIFKIFDNLSLSLRLQTFAVFLLLLVTSFAEMNFLIIFAEFIGLLTKEPTSSNPNFLISLFGDNCQTEISCVGLILGFSVLLSSFLRIFLIWCNSRLTANLEINLANNYFKNMLNNDYNFYIRHSSDKLISNLLNHVPAAGGALRSLFLFLTSLVLSIGIITTLYRLESSLTIITGCLYFLIYILLAIFTKRLVVNSGYIISRTNQRRIEVIQKSIGGIRDIIIDRSQNFLIREYFTNNRKLLFTQAIQQFIAQSPRYFLEGIGIFTIAIIAIFLSPNESNVLKSIAVVALGAQRLLPAVNQLFNGWMGLMSRKASLEIVVKGIKNKEKFHINSKVITSLNFDKQIYLDNVSFKYPSSDNYILRDISLNINKGERIGIIGKTGSGKTTLTDLLLGLLYPSKGQIFIDGNILNKSNSYSWHSQIAHVPQSLFISNTSIAENIAFCSEINSSIFKRILEVAKIVGIDEFIESLPEKYNTRVGERGIRLSGGQIQRLAIARALFKKTKLLILDEATSALDDHTQKNVMNSLKEFLKDITIIQITHRNSNLDFCDRVLSVNDQRIFEI